MAMAASYEGKLIVQQVPGWVEMVEISLHGARLAALVLAHPDIDMSPGKSDASETQA